MSEAHSDNLIPPTRSDSAGKSFRSLLARKEFAAVGRSGAIQEISLQLAARGSAFVYATKCPIDPDVKSNTDLDTRSS
jgi:hypothetical protein